MVVVLVLVLVLVVVVVPVLVLVLVLVLGTARRLVGGTDGTTACAALWPSCPTLACGTPDSTLALLQAFSFF